MNLFRLSTVVLLAALASAAGTKPSVPRRLRPR